MWQIWRLKKNCKKLLYNKYSVNKLEYNNIISLKMSHHDTHTNHYNGDNNKSNSHEPNMN